MRVGKRMREILQVLEGLDEPITPTEIIMRVKGLHLHRTHYTEIKDDQDNLVLVEIEKPWPRYVQCELASAIAKKSLSWGSATFTKVHEKHSDKEYHPITYADKLYALYSRSLKLLREHDLIRSNDIVSGRWIKGNRCKYYITEKGRSLLKA